MASEVKIIREFSLLLDPKKTLVRLGEKRPWQKTSESLRQALDEEKCRLLPLLRPAALYGIFDYDETNGHRVFDQAEKIALGLCTIGLEVEKEVGRLFQDGEALRGLILDSLASEAVKEVYWGVDRRIVEEARRLELWPSKRFSPGYRGWELREQAFIFSKLPAAEIGVTLTESFMMVPRKSLSFRINFYADRRLTTRKFSINRV